MPDPMTGFYEGPPRAERVEVITSVQRRRRWSTDEKVRIVEEAYLPRNSVSLVARHHGIAANQLFTWRRLMAQGALTAAGAGGGSASELRAAHIRSASCSGCSAEDARERDPARSGRARDRPQKAALARDLVAGGRPVSAVAAALGVSRPHLSSRQRTAPPRRGRPPLPDAGLLAAIQTLIADLPTYGYRRVHALLRRQAEREGRPAPNVKRVYRVMKVHGLLLQRHAGGEERRHEGRIAVDARNTRWCSDGLEIGCDNGERVRVAFALDCCDREAMSFVATTSGITGEDVRDLMVAAVEHRFGRLNRLPVEIEWLTDNGSCYLARETRRFARDVGLVPCTTPLESPQSNGMAEAFVRTLKRDYVRVSPVPDAETVLRQLPSWLAHYNQVHPRRAWGYRSPREFIARSTPEDLSGN